MEWKKKYRRETGKREIEVERRQETEVYLNAKKKKRLEENMRKQRYVKKRIKEKEE